MEEIKCSSFGNPSLDRVGVEEYLCSCCGTRLKYSNNQIIAVLEQGWTCTSCGFNNLVSNI